MVEVELALQTLGAVKGLVAGAFNAKVDHEVRTAQIEIQSKVLDLQGHLLNAVQERLSLVNELEEAKRKIRSLEEARARLDAYELVRTVDGGYLYKSKNDAGHSVHHYACPSCHDNAGKVCVLQERKTGKQQWYYECATCKFGLSVGPDDPMEPIQYPGRGGY